MTSAGTDQTAGRHRSDEDAVPRTPFWTARSEPVPNDEFPEGAVVDELVVGAGIAGLATALLLQRAGRRVLVLEARRVGAVATGSSTAKLSALQGAHLQKVRSRNTAKVTNAYVAGTLAGSRWLLDELASLGVPVERRTAYSYAMDADGLPSVEREYQVSRAAGLPVRRVPRLDVPFPSAGAVALDDQAQFDPQAVLRALAGEFRALGGLLVEDARVTAVRASAPTLVTTSRGRVHANRVYLTTGAPILDRGLYFAKLTAHRSYAMSLEAPGGFPATGTMADGMYLSVDEPSRSIRTTPGDDGDVLLLGGNGHPVGREESAAAQADELERWAAEYFPGGTVTHRWSAQDYRAPHRVPFVGWLPRGHGRIFLATGFDKWGMSNGAAAALTLVGDVLGETPAWAKVLHRRPTLPAVIADGIGSGAAVAAWMLRGWAGALTGPEAGSVAVPEGEGRIARDGVRPTAVSTVDGERCAVSGICPHLGGVVNWNDEARSWDCPLHGSRFAPDGSVLEGPARTGLAPRR